MKKIYSSSKAMMVYSVLVGVIYGLLGEVLINYLSNTVSGILLTFIYFFGLFLVVGIALYFWGKVIRSQYHEKILKKTWALSFLLIIVCSVLFEFIYEIIQPKEKEIEYTSYLFVIDNSSSMLASDPDGLRYKSISSLLSDKSPDFQYGVVSFESYTNIVRDMAPISKGQNIGEPYGDGSTEMRHALLYIKKEAEANNLKIDENTRIVLLSDGEPTDSFFKSSMMKALRYYANNGITISTVGLLYADDDYMQMIADKTGGVYVRCNDVNKLEDSLKYAVNNSGKERNLLSYRSGSFLNFVLGLLRVIFVGGIGLIFAVEKTAICDMFLDSKKVLITSVVCGILSGLCIEIGMNFIGISPLIMRMVTCILLSITFLDENFGKRMTNDSKDYKTTNISWGA